MTQSTQSSRIGTAICWIGVVSTIFLQILWPLSSDDGRATLTIATVCVFAGTVVIHAALTFGWRWAAAFSSITAIFTLAIEWFGTSTNVPFGEYVYSDRLGPSVAGVPALIPIAWLMMSYPAMLISRRIAAHYPRISWYPLAVIVGAGAMTSWDMFLDPQMVDADYWQWTHSSPSLPGIPGIPLSNFAGWLIATALLMAILHRIPTQPRFPADDGSLQPDVKVPIVLWTWTWIGGIVANAFFFGRPSVALVGGIAMGIFTIWYFAVVRSEQHSRSGIPSVISTGSDRR